MIALLARLVLALACPQGALAPAAPADLDRAAWDQHAACVLSERQQRFVAHYLVATPEAQVAALRGLEELRPRAAAPGWVPGIDALRRIESRLTGGDAAFSDLDELAGALDLVPLPGVFEARHDGLGDPVTVRVRRLYTLRPKEDFRLSLRWRAADGSELPARTEPIAAGAVSDAGFDMYVRAPLSGPGPWRLYGVLTRPDTGEVGFALAEVRVDAVRELRARAREALGRELENQPGLLHLRVALDRLLRSGRRLSASLGGLDLVHGIESWTEQGPATGQPAPLELVFRDARAVEHWLWTYGPSEEPVRAVAILSPHGEASDHVFAGDLGRTWIDFAERTRTQVFALHLPPQPETAREALERVRQWIGGRELVVVARGDGGARLSLVRVAPGEQLIDGLVVSSPFAARAEAGSFASVPRLCIGPGAAALGSKGSLRGVEGTGVVLIDDLSLPAHLERWLASLAQPDEGR